VIGAREWVKKGNDGFPQRTYSPPPGFARKERMTTVAGSSKYAFKRGLIARRIMAIRPGATRAGRRFTHLRDVQDWFERAV
jgi:hypothetical protein